MLRGLGLPELSAEAGGMDGGVCGIGASFPAILQDCTRQGRVECGGCGCSGIIAMDSVERKEQNRIAYVRRNYW